MILRYLKQVPKANSENVPIKNVQHRCGAGFRSVAPPPHMAPLVVRPQWSESKGTAPPPVAEARALCCMAPQSPSNSHRQSSTQNHLLQEVRTLGLAWIMLAWTTVEHDSVANQELHYTEAELGQACHLNPFSRKTGPVLIFVCKVYRSDGWHTQPVAIAGPNHFGLKYFLSETYPCHVNVVLVYECQHGHG